MFSLGQLIFAGAFFYYCNSYGFSSQGYWYAQTILQRQL
jgi:hypothetical protein